MKILIVEDHGDTRRVLSQLLGHFGHETSAADSVASALEFLNAKEFDAIVSDLGLPDGDGCDVVRAAKQNHKLAAVALTARNEAEDIRTGLEAGFDYHLTKPIDFGALRRVLDQITPRGSATA